MMRRELFATLTLMAAAGWVSVAQATPPAPAAEGLVVVKSPMSVKATADRVEALALQRGLSVFLRLDHAAGAAKVGKTLRPTELIVFGSPQAGTPFMECAQTVGIDLPLKALVWEDASAQVWVGVNDVGYLAARHGATACPVVDKLRSAVSSLVEAAVAK